MSEKSAFFDSFFFSVRDGLQEDSGIWAAEL